MARRKQNQPSRNISRATSELETNIKNTSRLSTDNTNDSTLGYTDKQIHTENGRVIYSKIALTDSVIDVAEINIQAVVYECAMSLNEEKGHIDHKSLEVRLYLPNLRKDSIVDLHALSHEDIRVEVFCKNDNSHQCPELEQESGKNLEVLLYGYLEGPKDSVSGIVYLFKAGFVSMKPHIQAKGDADIDTNGISCKLKIGITDKAFESSNGLLDSAKSLWSRNMLKVMKWLRPDLHTDEAIYGIRECDVSRFTSKKTISKQTFDASALYEAIRPNQNGVVIYSAPSKLRAKLRAYQCRAANWMISRENASDSKLAFNNGRWPFCLEVASIDGKSVFYYNPFSGAVSRTQFEGFPEIRGGILADEMGLGKTVEILACIMSNSYKPLNSEPDQAVQSAAKELDDEIKKRKRERIDCPCGVDNDESYDGIWVQCDRCDVWQHASCVGFGMEFEYLENVKRRILTKKQESKLQNTRRKRKRVETKHTINEDFVCGSCSKLIGSVEIDGISGATLIVCPPSILRQWQEEIARHTEDGALKLIVYEGFQRGGGMHSDDEVGGSKYGKVVGAHQLASADIVLTTYSTLQADLSHDMDIDDACQQRSLRYIKRYPVIPTPLTRMKWWRVCLDEAQMVENTSARATEMARRLNAEIRWCITGTPIQRSLDDLHGLLRFLDLVPFNDLFWWSRIIKEPYERNELGAMSFAHNYLKRFMWRTSKVDVLPELGLPPQEELLTWLQFSPIEAHFYGRQHERCYMKAMEAMAGSEFEDDRVLTYSEAAKILHPLLSLRQACCHPQVGSSGLRSLQKSPMTMDEVLKVLIEKAKIEGEEAQRNVIGALNGLAALLILEQDFTGAVRTYREALAVMEENTEVFDVDPLQKLHVLHNLHEVLEIPGNKLIVDSCIDGGQLSKNIPVESLSADSIVLPASKKQMTDHTCDKNVKHSVPRTLRDDLLEQQSQEISLKYMSSFYVKLAAARQDYKNAHNQVCKLLNNLEVSQGATWWLDALQLVSSSGKQANEFVHKLKDTLLERDFMALSKTGHENASSFALRFSDINGLTYILERELGTIYNYREKLISRISEVDQIMDNPSADDIARAGSCSNCKMRNKNERLCIHCEMDKLYQMYENHLFLLKSNAGSIGDVISLEDAFSFQEHKRRDANKLSEEDGKRKTSHTTNIQVTRSPSETEVILKYIKSSMKQKMGVDLATASAIQLEMLECMRKEYAQARALAVSQRMVLLALDELNMAKIRLCLRYPGEAISNETEEIFKIGLEEIPQRSVQLMGDKFVALDKLSRAKGQFRYLKGLAMTKGNLTETVDRDCSTSQLTEGDVVQENILNISEKKSVSIGGSEDKTCPVCHEALEMQLMVLPCGHMLCCRCLLMIAENDAHPISTIESKRILCPSCRYPTQMENIAFVDNGHSSTSHSLTTCRFQNSETEAEYSISVKGSYGTKMDAVVKRIMHMQAKDEKSKFLVFSTWNDVLDVVEHSLTANKVDFIRAKGQRKLDAAIKNFKGNDASARVLLLLIRQGANGLNLTEAQHVIFIEPLLNIGAEAQAINRVHRIGQQYATFVHRFLIKDTVEESIYKLSQQKSQSSVLRRNNQDVSALTMKDLKMLFNNNNNRSVRHDQTNKRQDPPSHLDLRILPPSVAAGVAAEARLMQANAGERSDVR